MGLLSYFSAAGHITEAASKYQIRLIRSARYRYFINVYGFILCLAWPHIEGLEHEEACSFIH